MPARLERPADGRRPTSELCELGIRIDPLVSVPSVKAAKHAAAAEPEPPLEPPGMSHVIRVPRLSTQRADAGQAQCQLVEIHFPEKNGASPAQLRNLEGVTRRHDITQCQRPPVVGISLVSKLSLSRTGMPCSGLRGPRDLRSSSTLARR